MVVVSPGWVVGRAHVVARSVVDVDGGAVGGERVRAVTLGDQRLRRPDGRGHLSGLVEAIYRGVSHLMVASISPTWQS